MKHETRNAKILFLPLAIVVGIFVLSGVFSGTAFANSHDCPVKPDGSFNLGDCNPLKAKDVTEVICSVATFLEVKLMPPIAVLMVLWASFLYLTAAGNPGNVTSAKQILVYTIIGAGILIIAPALIALVIDVFGGGAGGSKSSPCSQLAATTTLTAVFANLINWFSWFLAIVSVAAGLYSGFLYMTSSGDPRKAVMAGQVLFYAVIGIAVAILAFSIIALINGFIA